MTTQKNPLDSATTRKLAVKYDVHPHSLRKVLMGGVVRGLAGHRIRACLHAEGLMHLAPHFFSEPFGSVPNVAGVAADPDEAEETPAVAS